MMNFFRKHKKALLSASLLVVGFLVFANFALAADAGITGPQPAGAEATPPKPAGGAVGGGGVSGKGSGNTVFGYDVGATFVWGVSKVLYWIFIMIGYLMAAAMWALGVVMNPGLYETMIRLRPVSDAWIIVRDFCNIFFVIILLFVAICTILRIESYDAKKYLPKILLAALLINFSKPISLFIIDISQLAMNFFYNNIKSVDYAASLANAIGLGNVFQSEFSRDYIRDNFDQVTGIMVSMLFSIIFMFIYALMILFLALTFLFRIVAFWVLIILSPLAFLGMALPGTALGSAQSDWSKKMMSWAFFGPVMMFFLWLTLELVKGIGSINALTWSGAMGASAGGLMAGNGLNQAAQGILSRLLPFAVAIYLLFYGYDASKSMSTGAATSLLNTGNNWIKKYGRKAGKWGALATVGVGTGGAAVGAYYGGRAVGTRMADKYKGFMAGKADKPIWRNFSKEGQKRASEERQAEAKAKSSGKYDAYLNTKAQEQRKKWKDEASTPSETELKTMLRNKDPKKARAAAMELAEDGNLNVVGTTNYLKEAMNAAGSDKALQKKLMDSAREKNLHSLVDYQRSMGVTGFSTNQEGYKTLLKGKNIKDVKKQGIEIFQDPDFSAYLASEVIHTGGGTPPGGKIDQAAFAKQVHDNLGPGQIAELRMRLAPHGITI